MAVVGHKLQPVLLQIELTLLEIELSQIYLFLLKLLLIVKQEVVAMVVIQDLYMPLPKRMVFLKKVVRIMLPKILINLAVQLSKNVKIARILGARITVGQLQNIQFGK